MDELLQENLQFVIAMVVFVITIVGAVLYMRADSRATRQEIAALAGEVGSLSQRVTALEVEVKAFREQTDARFDAQREQTDARFDAQDARLGARIDGLAYQMQQNHRELLLRLALHHHGDGRYPVVPSADPDVERVGSD